MTKKRKAYNAGLFYPKDIKSLNNLLDKLFEQAELYLKKKFSYNKEILGIVSPHAGFKYSGKTAAIAFSNIIDRKFNKVFILSPSHREFFKGVSIYSGTSYETPLGEVEVLQFDKEQLEEYSSIFFSDVGHAEEHGIEVILPFIQKVNSNFQLIPLVFGEQNDQTIFEVSRFLSDNADSNSLLIASSDLSHFYNHAKANEMDLIIENCINNFNIDGLSESIYSGTCEACGFAPIISVMTAIQKIGLSESKVLYRTDSSEESKDYNSVVGYLSAIFN